jgi:hypothetical protein
VFSLLFTLACGGLTPFNAATEPGPTCSDPESADVDTDGDLVCDLDDRCEGSDDLADADQDGDPDGCDSCPEDPGNDSDLDGACDADDLCPGEDDGSDADRDDLPDACDPCPDDPLNDGDEDGVCDSVDPCPDDPVDACLVDLTVQLRCDAWPNEASWSLYLGPTPDPSALDNIEDGFFTQENEELTKVVPVASGWTFCVELYDSYGDGGVVGQILGPAGEVLDAWDGRYADTFRACVTAP